MKKTAFALIPAIAAVFTFSALNSKAQTAKDLDVTVFTPKGDTATHIIASRGVKGESGVSFQEKSSGLWTHINSPLKVKVDSIPSNGKPASKKDGKFYSNSDLNYVFTIYSDSGVVKLVANKWEDYEKDERGGGAGVIYPAEGTPYAIEPNTPMLMKETFKK